MRILKSPQIALSAIVFVFSLAGSAANAQTPAYLHAISDLRSARAYIQFDTRPGLSGSRQHAIDEITNAITDMKAAAVDEGKNPWQTPRPEGWTDPNSPLHSALTLLDEAYHDVASGQDIPQNVGLQIRSLKHIDVARRAIHHMIDQGQ